MANNKEAYQLFDVLSPIIHGVDQQSGKFHTFLPIASLTGNNGLGPSLDINLFYSPEMQDLTFVNWGLRLSHYLESSVDPNTSNSNAASILYLSTGEAWSLREDKFQGSPNFTTTFPGENDSTMTIFRKDGTLEILEVHTTTLVIPGATFTANLANYYILKKLVSPTGYSITLNWENHKRPGFIKGANGIDWYIPRLKSISDESKTLLTVDYAPYDTFIANTASSISIENITTVEELNTFIKSDDSGTITFNVYPGDSNGYSLEFDISNKGLKKSSRNKSTNATTFTYDLKNVAADGHVYTPRLTKIDHDTGITETIEYNTDDIKISKHSSSLNSKNISNLEYTYLLDQGKIKTTTAVNKINNSSVQYYLDTNQTQFKEVFTSGNITRTTESEFEYKNDNADSTIRTTYTNAAGQSRTEEVSATLDVLGNITSSTVKGVTTERTYYRGMPKEEDLVKKETYTDISGPLDVIGWIGDHSPIGMLFWAFADAGLTWGTREQHTLTRTRWLTNTGKKDFNLPVDIVCPGDPNYFRVYVESEKVYTLRNGLRVDLQWTFYGYGELPAKGSEVKGSAVKPTIKLTIRDPIGDANGKLTSWQDGKMTVEETHYITNIQSPHHGRVQSTTQRILDANGQAVSGSTYNIAFDYSLANGQLTTTTTISPENLPISTQTEIRQVTNDQILSTAAAAGGLTKYQYDTLGRLTQQDDCTNDGTAYATTQFAFVDSPSTGNTMTRTSAIGEKTRESFDPLGRLIKSERLHSDSTTWLTLTTKDYNDQGLEHSIIEYDYRPDGAIFLNHSRNLSYDEWGAVCKVEWSNGTIEGFNYDPVSRQQSQWIAYGTRNSASTTVAFDEPGGAIRYETVLSSNGQLTRSYTSTYDARGNLSYDSSSGALRSDYDFDSFGRLIRTTSTNELTINNYPAHTMAATASSAHLESAGRSITLGTRTVDILGRVTQATIGGRTTKFTYSANSSWGKADNARTSKNQQPTLITLQAAYDPIKNQSTETVTGGVERNAPSTAVSYTRSLRGILLSETDAFGNVTTYTYDAQGRMINSSNAISQVNLSYDNANRLATETLTNLSNNRSITTRYTYDSTDRESQRTFEATDFKTLKLTQDYNSSYQISGMALYESDTLLRKETFGYDNNGRLASYTCEGTRKPTTPEGLVLDKQVFTYDLVGNIMQCDNTSNSRTFSDTYQYDETDPTQLISATRWNPDSTPKNCNFTYDNLGFLNNNNGALLKYNSLDKLHSIQSAKGNHNYYYNNLGQVSGCEGTNYYDQYYYQGDYQYARKGVVQTNGKRYNRTCVLLNKSGACMLQQNTLSVDTGPSSTNYSFELKDMKGSLIASYNLLDNSSTFFSYTPFGYRPDDWQSSSWVGFNGQPIDRINGCYYLGNGVRVYDPHSQNFQSPDSLSPFGEGGANNRSYCHNDPVNYSDPSGRTEIVAQYTVYTHTPALQDPVVRAVVGGAIGVLLAPFTGGASIGWTVTAIGVAAVSAGFGIASAVLEKSDPDLAMALGLASMGTGIVSAGAGIIGTKFATRAALSTESYASKLTLPPAQRISRGAIYRGGNLPAGQSLQGSTTVAMPGMPVGSTYELYSGGQTSKILYIDAHGTAMESKYLLPPMQNTEVMFRSAPGVKAADVGTNWVTRVTGATPYRYAPGATNIPNYILDEFTVAEHIQLGSLQANYQPILSNIAQSLNADILRPTSTVILGDLINDLTSKGFQYDRIVANFCRGNMPYNTSPLVQKLRYAVGMF
ncbi:RHS repeat-associated core domain-containing protein [uncultured Pseudomonas sp.]|uniref:RHS repeat-associated core domain-containing protein n=1 Tax=uncultured Pseudomonas sp. TaxID=114707 RepID=UPI0025F25236|nr:RHS repeat-associated core domain-containing protein [uncultured Pseudomonas sp.]